MGEIDEWLVTPAEFETALINDHFLAHGIPEGCGIECDYPTTLVGSTPPQWKVSLHLPGWPVGTMLPVDWFEKAAGTKEKPVG